MSCFIRSTFAALLLACILPRASACIWDELARDVEMKRRPKVAEIVYTNPAPILPPEGLRKRLAIIEQENKIEDPLWHNNLAGTYLRLEQPEKALEILLPASKKFPEDYGIHANLASAYTLLKRYEEAEQQVTRALQLTSEPHYAERYHLALLQYLNRPLEYQKRHVYLDEYSVAFLKTLPAYLSAAPLDMENKEVSEEELTHLRLTYRSKTNKLMMETNALFAAADPAPGYTQLWDLTKDARWFDALLYLAAAYPSEPACWTMVGVGSLERKDFKPAIAAFDKAILLRSPLTDVLRVKNNDLKQMVDRSFRYREAQEHSGSTFATACLVVLVGAALLSLYKQSRKKPAEPVEP